MKSTKPDFEKRLPKLRIFNPARLSDEELEASFIVHQRLFEKLLGRIINEKKGHVPQHHLIVGQRGMGKTTLLCRIAAELRKPSYSKDYIPLQFPEEQYVEIDRLSKFWLNCLNSLADALEEEGDKSAVQDLDLKIRSLALDYKNEREVVRKAQKLFEVTARTSKRRLVLLVDNFHLLLERLKEEDYTLRAFFMREDAPILISASTVMLGDTNDYGAAFYDAFMIHLLHRLSLQEMQSVLKQLAQNSGDIELAARISNETPRLATLRDLTGGNPRTTVLLFELFARGFSKDAYEDLESLLDHMTPLYQSRLDQLSEQSQLVLGALARKWSPASAKQLTELTSLPRGSISTQLNRLEAIGMVEKVELSKGKKPGYQVAERFFNIWYLMRFARRRQRSDLIFLTRFLQEFYTPVELRQRALDLIEKGQLSEGERTYAVALAETGLDATTVQKLCVCVDESPYFYGEAKKAHLKKARQALNEDSLNDDSLVGLTRKEKAEVVFRKGVGISPDNADAWNDLGVCLCALGRYSKAIEKFEKAIELDPDNDKALFNWGSSLYALGRYDEAIGKYQKVVEINSNDANAWNDMGICLSALGRYDEVIDKFEKAVGINPDDTNTWYNWGNSLVALGRYDEAIDKYEKAVEIKPDNADAWNNLGNILSALGRYDESTEKYEKAVEIKSDNANAWYNWGNSLGASGRYNEAIEKFEKSVELNSDDAKAWYNWGVGLVALGRYEEAIKKYEKALEINPNYIKAWNYLGNCLLDYKGNFEKALEAFSKLLKLLPDSWVPLVNLAFLYRDFMDDPQKARGFVQKLADTEKFADAVELQEMLFASREQNWGQVQQHLSKALKLIQGEFPLNTHDDWYRASAVLLHQGYGPKLVKFLDGEGWNIRMMPWFEALRAHSLEERRHLLDIPQESREVAGEIYDQIAIRRQWLPESTRNLFVD
jgi:tetratricopeptide (TPR) repeat protein